MSNAGASVRSYLRHADDIRFIAPHVYVADADGALRGGVDRRVISAARQRNTAVMPVVRQNAFSQAVARALIVDPAARARLATALRRECASGGFWGVQLDFEHLEAGDRDGYTAFAREVADTLRRANCKLSIAVVPRDTDTPAAGYEKWMYDNWRGAYDYPALASTAEFLTLMTYDQSTQNTRAGPIAGLPWVRRMLDYAVAAGVDPAKLSLGIPAYSRMWVQKGKVSSTERSSAKGLRYASAVAVASRLGIQMKWNSRESVLMGRRTSGATSVFLCIENRRSFVAKRDLVDQYSLRGYAVWRLGQEDPSVFR